MSTLKEAVAAGRNLQEDKGNHTAPHGQGLLLSRHR